MPHRTKTYPPQLSRTSRTALVCTATIALTGVVAPAQAAQPHTVMPAFLTCRAVADGTVCSGSRVVEKPPYESDLVCGDGSAAFTVWDQGIEHQRLTIRLDADGNITRVVNDERWTSAMWSNPASGTTVPYTQQLLSILTFSDPSDSDTGTEAIIGEIVFTDPVTRRHVLLNVGRTVLAPSTGEILQSAGQQPFFSDDPSALGSVCAALE
jgi:hypothetical protein